MKYKYYELPYELQDRLGLVVNNSINRNMGILGSIYEDKAEVVEFIEFDLAGEDYVRTDYVVPSLVAVKQNLVNIIGKRYRNINNRLSNPTKDVSGFIVSTVSNSAELLFPFADPVQYNRNSVIILRLSADVSVSSPIRVPIGASVIIDLNSYVLTVNSNYLFEVNKNFGLISMFNGTLKIGSGVASYFHLIQEYMLGVYVEFGLTSVLSGFYPYDILNVSSSADKKLILDMNSLAIQFRYFEFSRQIKFMTSDDKIEFVNDGSLTGKYIATGSATGTGIFVFNGGNISMIDHAQQNNIFGHTIPSNLLFTV